MADTEVAIVTGGIQGIGASITKVLLNKGYRVVVSDLQDEKGQEFVKELKKTYGESKALYLRCDVTKPDDYKDLFENTLKEFKRVDVLVNNAGVICEKNPQLLMNINVLGVLNGCQTALQYMGKSKGGKGGIVVNTASIAGFLIHPGFPVYCASKHAVIGLTRGFGHSYYEEQESVIFCAICPSYVQTNMLNNLADQSTIRETDFITNRKLLNPDDVAQGVIKLLEDRINGSTLVSTVDEGFFYVGLPKEFDNISLE